MNYGLRLSEHSHRKGDARSAHARFSLRAPDGGSARWSQERFTHRTAEPGRVTLAVGADMTRDRVETAQQREKSMTRHFAPTLHVAAGSWWFSCRLAERIGSGAPAGEAAR